VRVCHGFNNEKNVFVLQLFDCNRLTFKRSAKGVVGEAGGVGEGKKLIGEVLKTEMFLCKSLVNEKR